jgi:ribosomal protein L33
MSFIIPLISDQLLSSSFYSLRKNLQQMLMKLKVNWFDKKLKNHFLNLVKKEATRDDKQACWMFSACTYYNHWNIKDKDLMKEFAERSLHYREGVFLLSAYYFYYFHEYSNITFLLAQASEAGLLAAKFYLACNIYYGRDTQKNIPKAISLFNELGFFGERYQTLSYSITLNDGCFSFLQSITLSKEFSRTSQNQPFALFSYFQDFLQ